MIRMSRLWSCPQWTVSTLGPPTCPWRSPRTWLRDCIVCTATPLSGGCPSSSSIWCDRRRGWRRRSSRPPLSWALNTPSSGKDTDHFSMCVALYSPFSGVINTSVLLCFYSISLCFTIKANRPHRKKKTKMQPKGCGEIQTLLRLRLM